MLALAALGAATPIVAVAQSRDANTKEWKLSTAVGTAFALGKAGERWAALVTENSGGKLAVVLRPGATLAERDPAREFTALRSGAADLAIGSTLYWSVQVRELGVVGLPWIAPEEKQLDALVTGVIAEKLAAAYRPAARCRSRSRRSVIASSQRSHPPCARPTISRGGPCASRRRRISSISTRDWRRGPGHVVHRRAGRI